MALKLSCEEWERSRGIDGIRAANAKMSARIAELEAALKPFANMLANTATKDIDPRQMWRHIPDPEDADFTGEDVIVARVALRMD